MKKRAIIVSLLIILSFALAFGTSVIAFSSDNLSNKKNNLKTQLFSLDQIEFKDFTKSDDKLICGLDAQIIIKDINGYVNNLCFSGEFPTELEKVEVFFMTDSDAEFTQQNSYIAPTTVKNSDLYIPIQRDIKDLRIDITEPNTVIELNFVETNSRRLNIKTVNFVLIFLFASVISICLYLLFFERRGLHKDIFALGRYRYLLTNLVAKDIKTKYRRSVLGVLWSVLNPLLMMLVLTAVFSNIIRVEVEGGFALFYLTGYIIYNFISESSSFSLTSILSAGPLIKKVYVPKYIFPLEKTIFSLVNMLFSLFAFVIVFVVFLIMGDATLKWSMLLFFVPVIYVFIFAFGLNLVVSTVNVFFRDLLHIWGVFLTVWMYASPIIYPISLVPNWLASIIKLNPLYYYIDYFRSVMIYGTIPSLAENLICIFFSVSMLLFGVLVFQKKQDKFILYI